MAKVMVLDTLLNPDDMGCEIAKKWQTWDDFRQAKLQEWVEIQQYIFAVDTNHTSNRNLPWSNKTTIPKLCQIRDNLHANYMASLFPKRKWLFWIGDNEKDNSLKKKKAIESYMSWVIDRNEFVSEAAKLVLDYIDYGNVIGTVEWVNNSAPAGDKSKERYGYVGPMIRRVSPMDFVMDPTATDFASSPKIIRSMVSIGEVKEMLEKAGQDPEQAEQAKALWSYIKDLRHQISQHPGNWKVKNDLYQVAGFSNFADYLQSGQVEVLTFFGDMYDVHSDTFYKNHVIKVIDRHKIIALNPNPSYFGTAAIFHCGWRVRPDNLWAMGPLDNLVGMQYRIDHLENLKADVFDLNAQPMFKIKGHVDPFEWVPGKKIYVGDDGDVELIKPDFQILQTNNEIAELEQKMEQMAGSPREAMGFRTPGEKTKYEVQRLENAAGRVFQAKINQFERDLIEPLINAMLEMSRRNMDSTYIRIFDSEFAIEDFMELSPLDITGAGRIKPIAARHFAEQSQIVQDLSGFFNSPVGQDPEVKNHFSSIKLAKMLEILLNIEDYKLVQENVRLAERADSQKLTNALTEQVATEGQTPTNFLSGDTDPNASQFPMGQMPGQGS